MEGIERIFRLDLSPYSARLRLEVGNWPFFSCWQSAAQVDLCRFHNFRFDGIWFIDVLASHLPGRAGIEIRVLKLRGNER
jgi:hypothetical protein